MSDQVIPLPISTKASLGFGLFAMNAIGTGGVCAVLHGERPASLALRLAGYFFLFGVANAYAVIVSVITPSKTHGESVGQALTRRAFGLSALSFVIGLAFAFAWAFAFPSLF